jgi:hypothetical protein
MPKRVAVLLGAGASVEAGVPDTTAMTKRVVENVNATSGHQPWPTVPLALNYVVATLNARETLRGGNPFATVDVERVFSTVEFLAKRDDHDISAFVDAWSSNILQIDKGAATDLSLIARNVRKELNDSRIGNDSRLANLLGEFITKMVGTSSGPTFAQTLSRMVVALEEILTIHTDDDVAYLRPLAELANRQGGLTVATLNYDLAVEKMSRSAEINCETGITTWSRGGGWEFPGSGISLLKLHGSINWRLSGTSGAPGLLPQQQILETDEPPQSGSYFSRDVPAIIFGQTKLRPDGPFIELLLEFSRRLDDIDHLVVVGYSFRDDHINEQIRRWVNADKDHTMTIIDPRLPERKSWSRDPSFVDQLLMSLIPPSPSTMPDGQVIAVPPEQQFAARLTPIRGGAKTSLAAVLSGAD